MTEVSVLRIGNSIMSGHCGNPATHDSNHQPIDTYHSHERCQQNGGGIVNRMTGAFHPCPCTCHTVGEEYECSECGDVIYEAPTLGPDEDGDPQYTHISEDGLRMTGVYCP